MKKNEIFKEPVGCMRGSHDDSTVLLCYYIYY